MHADTYIQFATIIGFACLFGIGLHMLRQPLVAAYLLAGVLLSFFQVVHIPVYSPLEFLPTIGIAFLLFLIGMELDVQELRVLGKPILLAGVGQVAFMTAGIAVVCNLLGFPTTQAVLLGFALSFSSTIVVIKLLLDKHEMASYHGKVALGILMLQDIIAIGVLMVLSFVGTNTNGQGSLVPIGLFLVKGIALIGCLALIIHFLIDRFFKFVADNQELLFLSAISWCFLFIVISLKLGFTLEIGAFLAGLSLASSPYRFQIAGRLKPLRDLFIAIFFVNLGQGILFADVTHHIGLILTFSVIALIAKPLLFMVILSLLGFRRYTVYQASTAMSQISEFSILIFFAAEQFGFVDHTLLSAIAVATILTIFISAILINQNALLYQLVRRFLKLFERKTTREQMTEKTELTGHIILVGVQHDDDPVIEYLKEKAGDKLLIVDSNPALVEQLARKHLIVLFGDIADPDILEQLKFANAKLVIATLPNKKDNAILLDHVRRSGSDAVIILSAETDEEANTLYRLGAHEVIVPTHLEGLHVINLLSHHWPNIDSLKQNHARALEQEVM